MADFNRTYYRIKMTLVSPMSVGSGESEVTDHDVFVDSRGLPKIPATAIAGVMRAYLGEDDGKKLFGFIPTEKSSNKICLESQLRIYDAKCTKGDKTYITNRDFVKLENKLGVEGAKFDTQIVETGAEFVSYIELLDRSYADKVESALSALHYGYIGFGAKTTRGFGRVELEVAKRTFEDIEHWLKFKMFEEDGWKSADTVALKSISPDKAVIKIDLCSKGGISIREYSTEKNMPDYKTLSLKTAPTLTPVIPGTSWSGAFRDRCSKILSHDEIINCFGDVNETTTVSVRSKIEFSESKLKGGQSKDITRNAIDRFSGGTKSGSLYTERTYYGGETTLVITLPLDKRLISAIAVCLADLHNGFLAVGGLTAVGRGLFEVKKIQVGGNDLTNYITGEQINISGFAEEVLSNDRK